MDRLNELKEKWTRLAAEDRGGERFDYDFLAPGSFCLHLADGLGEGPCGSSVEVTGFFESPQDALAYLLVVQIPHILDWDSGVRGERDKPVEEYMGCYSGEKRATLEQLIGMIESALRSGKADETTLGLIRGAFNVCFEHTEPMNEIMAWGRMEQVMTAACFDEAWEEMLDMEAGEDGDEDGDGEEDEDAEPGEMTVMKRLLESDEFDEQDEEHLELARVFFESVMVG